MSDAAEWCALAAAHGLTRREPVTLTDDDVMALIETADEARVLGLVTAAAHDGEFQVSEWALEQISERNAKALHQCLLAEEAAVLATEALARRDVPCRVLKGIAIAHLDEADPALRHFGDADLLVPRGSWPTAVAVLEASGFRRDEPPVRGWWEQRYGKGTMLLAPNGAELDLHLAFVGGWFGAAAELASIWHEGSEPFTLAGVTMHAVTRPVRLVHAAYHAVLGRGSGVRALRDIAVLATSGPETWASARSLARQWQGEVVLAEGVRRAWNTLGLDPALPAAQWAHEIRPTAIEERHLAAYRREAGSEWSGEGLTALPAMPWRERVAYLAGLALPSRASLRHRNRTVPQHLRRLVRRSQGGTE